VSDQQVKQLWRLAGQKWALEIAAAKAGMDPKTARKYLRDRRLHHGLQIPTKSQPFSTATRFQFLQNETR
jgi:hypothetical protein